MKRLTRAMLVFMGILLLAAALRPWVFNSLQSAMADESEPLKGRIYAPDFPTHLEWLNTGGKHLRLAKLRGKIVLLDFWTYGCINCIHIIPDLKKLEEKYHDTLVVIGVHSAKFEHEGKTNNIRRLVLRYDLEHPVVNDKDYEVWKEYGARAWPTLVLIDPEGKVIGSVSGEGHYDLLDNLIQRLINTFEPEGKIDRTPLDLPLEKAELADTPLLFPGKVEADPKNNRLFISDTNHHRIVITDLDGKVQQVIGGRELGNVDGDFKTARFNMPHGLSLADDNTLYVADTENHVIRKVDLASGQVTTVAGTGRQKFQRELYGPALEMDLNSPWDVLWHDGLVYIAMAGQHQIWSYDPAEEWVAEFAGSRREELKDGKLLHAGLNQPSGLAIYGDDLYIADSEASAIRRADLDPEGNLDTVIGIGLFDFGDRDGKGRHVRLQHPLGVGIWPREDGSPRVVIADTYNGKIKVLDPATTETQTINATRGQLDEPGGLSVVGDTAWIADTNNHAIRKLDLNNNSLSRVIITDPDQLL